MKYLLQLKNPWNPEAFLEVSRKYHYVMSDGFFHEGEKSYKVTSPYGQLVFPAENVVFALEIPLDMTLPATPSWIVEL